MRRRPCSVTKHWLRGVCSSMSVNSEFTHRIWQQIRPMEVESFSHGSWHETFNRTFRLSIAATRPKDTSHESIFSSNQKRMPTTVPKGNRCTMEVSGVVAGAIFIARQKRNVADVHKSNPVPQVPIVDYLSIGRIRRDKQFARWQAHQSTSARNERVTRSRLCLPNSSNRSSCARHDCGDFGM